MTAILAEDLTTEAAADLPIPEESRGMTLLPIAQIDPCPDNPRDDLGDLTDLAGSIHENGDRLLQPIVVVPAEAYRAGANQIPDSADEGRYVVIAGHRRLGACKLLGLDQIDAIIRHDLVGDQARIAMLVENLQRVDLHVLEEARAFAALEDLGWKQRTIASRVGRAQSHVSKRLSLLKLPEIALQAVLDDQVSLADAAAVAKLADRPQVFDDAWERLTRYRWSAKQAVDHAEGQQHRREAVEKATQELEAAGTAIFKGRPLTYFYGSSLTGTATLKVVREAGGKITTKAHSKLPCHAAWIEEKYDNRVEVLAVCSNPKSHIPKATADPAAAAEKAHKKALSDAAKGRHEILRQIIRQGLPDKDRNRLLIDYTISAGTGAIGNVDAAKLALTLLDQDGVKKSSGYHPYALAEVLKSWPRANAALTIALCDLEVQLERDDWAGFAGYFDLLMANGHQLSEVEQRKLAKDQQEADEATAAIEASRCTSCGCTLDGPCDQAGHCESPTGEILCTLTEGSGNCSVCALQIAAGETPAAVQK